MNDIYVQYENECQRKSDINEHLPTLKSYADKCDHITEMGVRNVVSTWAFLAGNPKEMKCIDIENCPVQLAEQLSNKNNINFEFIIGDTTEIEIDQTDLLFIDTHHCYSHLKKELELHGNKSSKYIIMHDTSKSSADPDLSHLSKGDAMMKAIMKFIENNSHWSIKERFTNNYGLTILERDN